MPNISVLQFWPQWIAALEVSLLATTIGLVTGWTSPYLAQLTSREAALPITLQQASWIASLVPVGRLFGAVVGAISVEFMGSKRTLMLTSLPLVPGWICIICANSARWLYASRIFSGSSMGMIFTCFPLYIGEIAAPQIRGALVGCVINGMPLGTVLGNIMGANLSMTWFAIVGLIVNCSFFLIFSQVPRSPHYFVKKNMFNEATKAVVWYHREVDANEELAAVQKFVDASRETSFKARLQEMKQPRNKKAFAITVLLFFFMQISGVNSVLFYMEIIVREAKVSTLKPSTVVIIVNMVGIAFAWIAVYAIDRFGRRLLLGISNIGVVVGMTMSGVHFSLLRAGYDAADLEWLPILSLVTFMLVCIGLVPVPSTMLGELFPANLKSVAGCVASAFAALFGFISSKTYQPLREAMAVQYVFWIHAAIMVASLVFGLACVPETKGKSLHEIQDMLLKREAERTGEEEGNVSEEGRNDQAA